jgi:formylglycine-generating enzyme required for sulfatase activity
VSVTRIACLGAAVGLLCLAAPAATGGGVHAGMVRIPAGAFVQGCNEEASEALGVVCEDDPARFTALNGPAFEVEVEEFWIDEHEVTVAAHAACVEAGACTPSLAPPPTGVPEAEVGQVPVTGVTWAQAVEHCAWRGKRLPTESEWEKAARGTDRRVMPWGNALPACGTANVLVMGRPCPGAPRHPTPVHWFPADVSPYGVRGMAGNVQEWVSDWRTRAPGAADPGSEGGKPRRVVRGGYYGSALPGLTLPVRRGVVPDRALPRVGFRCASD